ncbi:hypothetical protein VTL71DRAFT_11620 [Oculimacula yallundae]|uniref:Uncharacterized protein n=1 Tax=Oculimacula yallundae TaxID=86028 RepID=A0ABR4CQK4_9HELO
MARAKHDQGSAERIARSRGANSREAKSAARAAKHNKSSSDQTGGDSGSGSGSGNGSGSGGGGGGSAEAWECPNNNRSGGRCSTQEPCLAHIPSWSINTVTLQQRQGEEREESRDKPRPPRNHSGSQPFTFQRSFSIFDSKAAVQNHLSRFRNRLAIKPAPHDAHVLSYQRPLLFPYFQLPSNYDMHAWVC